MRFRYFEVPNWKNWHNARYGVLGLLLIYLHIFSYFSLFLFFLLFWFYLYGISENLKLGNSNFRSLIRLRFNGVKISFPIKEQQSLGTIYTKTNKYMNKAKQFRFSKYLIIKNGDLLHRNWPKQYWNHVGNYLII